LIKKEFILTKKLNRFYLQKILVLYRMKEVVIELNSIVQVSPSNKGIKTLLLIRVYFTEINIVFLSTIRKLSGLVLIKSKKEFV
jgi:hypothetical protein